MGDFGAPKDKWVCPNDRELSLRAKLKVGWSVKTNSNNFNKPEQLNDSEQEVIMNVIRRAELLDRVEQERVGRLVERLDNMKRNAMGNGSTQCILCADEFGILGASPLLCNDCRKAVCTKCGVDTVSANKEPLWLCKICAETRETWKKSGAWFYKGLPKYVLPGKKGEQGKYTTTASTPIRSTVDHGGTGSPVRSYNSWMQSKGRSVSDREYTDSSDDEIKTSRLTKKGTMRKQTQGESVDIPDQPPPGQYSVTPPAEATPQGPSPTHMYSLTPELPHSPRSPHKEIAEKSPGYESAPAYGRERRIEPERSIHTSTTTGSYWYKPNARRDNLEEEEYIPTETSSLRPHPRRDGHHTASPRHRQAASNREGQPYEEKPSPEESSKRQKYFYRGKKRKKTLCFQRVFP